MADDEHGSSQPAASASEEPAGQPAPAGGDVLELSLEPTQDGPAEGKTYLSAGADAPDEDDDPDAAAASPDDGKPGGAAAGEAQPDLDADGSSSKARRSRAKKSPDGTSAPIVIDASDHVAGRLSSVVAKMLLQGQRVSLVNCERIMISGTRSNIIGEYRKFLKINSIINPKHGPVHYRRPDTVITKMIRGMLPFEKKPSGKTAHKRLRAYVGSPRDLKQFKKTQLVGAMIRRPASTYTTMGELCRVVGWTE